MIKAKSTWINHKHIKIQFSVKLRHNVTEFSPKYERGEIPYWTKLCMVGIYLPRQLMDYIGFGPEWTHWAVRAQFKFLGCERPDFNYF